MATPEIILLIIRFLIAILLGSFLGVSIVVFKKTLDVEQKYDDITVKTLNHIREVINLNKELINRNQELTNGLKVMVESYNKLLDYNENYLAFIKRYMIRRKTPIED